ncbi:phospholipase A1-II 7-like [Curcuma longa]|uniref:phospholipase A1-II 7-like n=1 Tax=Curcuma longa TaxID=136217 RepID=UPI003D9DE9D6
MSSELGSIARRWRQLQGEDGWKGLLEPLDDDLRRSLVLYGELDQAVYDGFIQERKSRFAGAPRYARRDLLEKSALTQGQAGTYRVTRYLYAMSGEGLPESLIVTSLVPGAWTTASNFMGYVAVATDEGAAALGRRDVVVAWRGTQLPLDWVNNLDCTMVPAPELLGTNGPRVHCGWLSLYTSADPTSPYNKTSARQQVLEEVRRLVDEYKDEQMSITVTGHSLGAAVATLNSIDMVINGINRPSSSSSSSSFACPVTGFVFACPRAGDLQFKQLFSRQSDLHLLRVHNTPDIVPNYPILPYVDVGDELRINTQASTYLKQPGDVFAWHNLECYLHGVAGVQNGRNPSFKLAIDRDIALVNKCTNALRNDFLVPDSWWVHKNMCMVKEADGHWKLEDHEEDDDP